MVPETMIKRDVRIVIAQQPQGIGRAEPLHRVIAQHDVPGPALDGFDEFLAGFGDALLDSEPVAHQFAADQLDIVGRILREEHT